MKNQNGKISAALATVIVFLGVMMCAIAIVIGSYVSAVNKSASYSANIERFHEQSKNVLSEYTLKIREMAQVPDMYTEALQKHVESTFTGRYGSNGSQAMMQWITENNIEFDSSMFRNLQATMESGRNAFSLSQTRKLDICANYKKEFNYFWSGFWLNIAGAVYPTDQCSIIIDSETATQFNTGVAEVIKLR